jgi:hypothetical protein
MPGTKKRRSVEALLLQTPPSWLGPIPSLCLFMACLYTRYEVVSFVELSFPNALALTGGRRCNCGSRECRGIVNVQDNNGDESFLVRRDDLTPLDAEAAAALMATPDALASYMRKKKLKKRGGRGPRYRKVQGRR